MRDWLRTLFRRRNPIPLREAATHDPEFERGRIWALTDVKRQWLSIAELEASWERCQSGDSYDRGYIAGLSEAKARLASKGEDRR